MNFDINTPLDDLSGAASTPSQIPTPAPGAYIPHISEDNFDQEAWDEWYREQIRLSIEDPRPNIPHEEVVDWIERKLQAMRLRHAKAQNA